MHVPARDLPGRRDFVSLSLSQDTRSNIEIYGKKKLHTEVLTVKKNKS